MFIKWIEHNMAVWRNEIYFLVLKNFSLVRGPNLWNIFQHSRRNFVSPRSHVTSSIYYSFKILAPIPRLVPHNPPALTIFGRRKQYTINLHSLKFTQLNRDCHCLIFGHMALTKIKCIPIYLKPDCTQLGIHNSTWSKYGGKWGDRRREKRC